MFDNVGGRTLSELFIFIGIGEWIVLPIIHSERYLQSPNSHIINNQWGIAAGITVQMPCGIPLIASVPEIGGGSGGLIVPWLAAGILGCVGEIVDATNSQVHDKIEFLVEGCDWGTTFPGILALEATTIPEAAVCPDGAVINAINDETEFFGGPFHGVSVEVVAEAIPPIPEEMRCRPAILLGRGSKVQGGAYLLSTNVDTILN